MELHSRACSWRQETDEKAIAVVQPRDPSSLDWSGDRCGGYDMLLGWMCPADWKVKVIGRRTSVKKRWGNESRLPPPFLSWVRGGVVAWLTEVGRIRRGVGYKGGGWGWIVWHIRSLFLLDVKVAFWEGDWTEHVMEQSRCPLKVQTVIERVVVQGSGYGHLHQQGGISSGVNWNEFLVVTVQWGCSQ